MVELGKETVVAKYDYYATESHELTVLQGERLTLLDGSLPWWKVANSAGEIGYVPSNYIRPVKQNLLSTLKNTLTRRKTALCKSLKQQTPAIQQKPRATDCPRQCSIPSVLPTHGSKPVHDIRSYNGRNTIPQERPKPMRPTGLQKGKPDSKEFTSLENKDYPGTGNGMTRIKHTYNEGSSTPHLFGPEIRVNRAPLVSSEAVGDISADFDCLVLLPYEAQLADELSIRPGDRLRVIKRSADGWWFGALLENGRPTVTGWFPSNLVCREQSPKTLINPSKVTNTSPLLAPDDTWDNKNTLCTRVKFCPPEQNTQHSYATAITLYPFARNQLEELSFEANEVLEVLDWPVSNADWWRCRNAYGDVGWAPRNHLQLLSGPKQTTTTNLSLISPDQFGVQETIPAKTSVSVDSELRRLSYARRSKLVKRFVTKPWFWGALSRIECERMLSQFAVPGEFVIRDSESDPGHLSLTVNTGDCNRNFKILLVSGRFRIGWRLFDTVDELIHHYQTHFIFTGDAQERYSLTRPFVHPGSVEVEVEPEHDGPLYSSGFRSYDAAAAIEPVPRTRHAKSPGNIPYYM